jgi:hypothetical protein
MYLDKIKELCRTVQQYFSENVNKLVYLLTPPIIIKLIKPGTRGNTFDGVYKDFDDIKVLIHYNDESSHVTVLNEIVAKLERHKSKNIPESDTRSQITNLLPLLISAIDKEKLSVLDYGGGAGSMYIDSINL